MIPLPAFILLHTPAAITYICFGRPIEAEPNEHDVKSACCWSLHAGRQEQTYCSNCTLIPLLLWF